MFFQNSYVETQPFDMAIYGDRTDKIVPGPEFEFLVSEDKCTFKKILVYKNSFFHHEDMQR